MDTAAAADPIRRVNVPAGGVVTVGGLHVGANFPCTPWLLVNNVHAAKKKCHLEPSRS